MCSLVLKPLFLGEGEIHQNPRAASASGSKIHGIPAPSAPTKEGENVRAAA